MEFSCGKLPTRVSVDFPVRQVYHTINGDKKQSSERAIRQKRTVCRRK